MATKVDEELANAVKTARRGKPLRFAFIPKAQGGKLLLGKKILPKDIAESKKEIGGAAVFQGRCVGEDGTLYFEVIKDVPQALPLQIKRAIKQDAGLVVDCLMRVKSDAEADVEGDEAAAEAAPAATEAPPAPPPPTPERMAVVQRLNKLSPDIKNLLTQKGPHATRIQSLFVAVSGLIKNQDFEQGGKVLDELEQVIAQAKAPAAPPATPPGAPPATAERAALVQRLNKLSPGLKAALAQKGPNASRIQSLFVSINGLLKNEDLEQARKVLDELEPLVAPATAGGAAVAAAPVSKTVAAEIAKPQVVAQIAEKTVKVAAAARPAAPPRQALTNDLRKAIAAKKPPERIEDVPNHVAELVPNFLMTMASELAQTSKGLKTGAELPAQDQMLCVADSLNAVMRSTRKWEDLLKQGELADKRLDELDKAKQSGDQQAEAEYEIVLDEYNAARAGGLAEQARTMKLVNALLAEYKGLQANPPAA